MKRYLSKEKSPITHFNNFSAFQKETIHIKNNAQHINNYYSSFFVLYYKNSFYHCAFKEQMSTFHNILTHTHLSDTVSRRAS